MLSKLIPIFVIIPLIELLILIQIGSYIGALNTVMLVIITGFIGALVMRWQGLITWRKIEKDLQSMHMPTDTIIDGVLILVGGIVLLTPGVLTDLLGFLLLIPPSRILIREYLKRRFQKRIKRESKVIDVKMIK